MNYEEMAEMEREKLKLIEELGIPGDYEYAKSNEKIFKYICDTRTKITAAMCEGRDEDFKLELERYFKAWAKIRQLMAKEHYKSRPFEEVDLRYYRHLPDGYSFVMDSKLFGKIQVFPRKPDNPPTDIKWMTAGDLINVHESPIIFEFIKEFEGSWFNHSEDTSKATALVLATEESKRNYKNKPPTLVRKRSHKGMEYYERETIRGRSKKVSEETGPERLRVQNKRPVLAGDPGLDDGDLG